MTEAASVDALKTAINEILDERDGFNGRTHADHHRFVAELIDERKKSKERRERLRQQVIGWGAITFLSGVGYSFYQVFVELVKKASH